MDHGADAPAVLAFADGHSPQPGGAAVSQYIGIDLHKSKSSVTRLTSRSEAQRFDCATGSHFILGREPV